MTNRNYEKAPILAFLTTIFVLLGFIALSAWILTPCSTAWEVVGGVTCPKTTYYDDGYGSSSYYDDSSHGADDWYADVYPFTGEGAEVPGIRGKKF